MKKLLITFVAISITFLAMDMLWLGVIAAPIYTTYLSTLMAPQVHILGAVLFYLLYMVGIICFVLLPQRSKKWTHSLGMGALFGVVAYGTFDLTALAVLKDWPWEIVPIDMAWGGIVTGVTSMVGWKTLQ